MYGQGGMNHSQSMMPTFVRQNTGENPVRNSTTTIFQRIDNKQHGGLSDLKVVGVASNASNTPHTPKEQIK